MKNWSERPKDPTLPFVVLNSPASDVLVFDAKNEAIHHASDLVLKYRGRSYVVRVVAEIVSLPEGNGQTIKVIDWE